MIDPSRLSIGRYLPAHTAIHRIDARTKIVCVVGVLSALFLAPTWHCWLAGLVCLSLVTSIAGIPVVYLTGNAKPLIPILTLTLLLNGTATPGEAVHADIPLTWEGLRRGGTLCLRLIVIVTATSVLSLTTSPLDLADGLEGLCRPLSWLRMPIHELALTATIALRLIPLLADEAARIRTAQLARGAATGGSLVLRVKNLGAILVPLFVTSFARAERLADAMEARCYRGAKGRTRYREQCFRVADGIAFGICALFSAAAILVDVS